MINALFILFPYLEMNDIFLKPKRFEMKDTKYLLKIDVQEVNLNIKMYQISNLLIYLGSTNGCGRINVEQTNVRNCILR